MFVKLLVFLVQVDEWFLCYYQSPMFKVTFALISVCLSSAILKSYASLVNCVTKFKLAVITILKQQKGYGISLKRIVKNRKLLLKIY